MFGVMKNETKKKRKTLDEFVTTYFLCYDLSNAQGNGVRKIILGNLICNSELNFEGLDDFEYSTIFFL